MNERRSDFVIKAGYMVKRSQNKKRFTPVNYKTRWFELTRFYLSYYDIGNLEVSAFLFLCVVCVCDHDHPIATHFPMTPPSCA